MSQLLEENGNSKDNKVIPMITKHPDPVKVFSLDEWNKSCCNKELHNLLEILKDKMLTLSEIHEQYQKYENKSKVTIHRYLKDYTEKGFIIIAGRVIKPKQTASEKLFSLSANIFVVDNLYSDAWQTPEDRPEDLAQRFGVLLYDSAFDGNSFDTKSMVDLFLKYEVSKLETAKETLEKLVEKSKASPEDKTLKSLIDSIFSLREDDALVFFTVLKNMLWFVTDKNVEKFRDSINEAFNSDKKYEFDYDQPIWKKGKKDDFKQLYIGDLDSTKGGYAINYERENLSFLNFEMFQKYTMDFKYNAILTIFKVNQMPLTVKEITEKYPLAYKLVKEKMFCKVSREKAEEQEKKEEKEELSENRIYRLIQEFKKDGLVVEAGRKITEDSNKSFFLYTTKSKQFIYLENRDEYWRLQESWEKLSNIIGNVVKFYLNTSKDYNNQLFIEYLTEFERDKFGSFKDVISNSDNKKIQRFMHAMNNIEFNALIDVVGITCYLKNKESEVLKLKNNILTNFK